MERMIQKLPYETTEKLDSMLQKAIELSHADKGTLQIYDHPKDLLLIVCQQGFSSTFLGHFKYVKPFDGSTCGRAAGTGMIVNISDVTQDAAFRSHVGTALDAGVKAVQSVPLYYDEHLVGVISVHYGDPKPRMTRNSPIIPIVSELAKALHNIVALKEQQSHVS